MGQVPHLQDHSLSDLGGLGKGRGTEASEEEERADVP